jgi:hypothetical protein
MQSKRHTEPCGPYFWAKCPYAFQSAPTWLSKKIIASSRFLSENCIKGHHPERPRLSHSEPPQERTEVKMLVHRQK